MGPVTSDAPYAFVSYSSADRARVFGITGVLEAQGIPLWLDRRSISGGRRWTTEIVRGVEDAAVLVVMCSPASVASRNVQQEVQLAWESERRILPVIVEEVQLPAELRYALAGQQWVEVRDRTEAEWLPELLAALRASGLVAEVAADPASLAAEEVPVPTVLEEPVEKKRTHNLPAPRASFVGRATQLAEIERALDDHRVVTLTGPGGVGKSRLALELAWRLLPDYPDGVWLAAFDTASDPALVPELVATAAGVREIPGRPLTLQLADRLAGKSALLVLDNCEGLLDPCADLTGALIAGGPKLRVLATSREVLGMAGEVVFPLAPLAVQELGTYLALDELRGNEAVQLFLDRAAAASPEFEPNPRNVRAVAGICHALDGIPLAIELAAARMRALTPQQLQARLGDVFGLLRRTERTALSRQRTLRGAVDWSYESLEEEERVLWRRLSVFEEGFSLSAAEAACGFDPLEGYEVMDLLTSLVDKSLVMTVRAGAEFRYRLLKTLRQYAADKLRDSGEETGLRDRHAAWCAEVAKAGDLALVKVEYPNLRAALEYLIACDRGREALEIAGTQGLLTMWWLHYEHSSDGRRLLELILARTPSDRTIHRARALVLLGNLHTMALRTDQAKALLGEALVLAREIGDHSLVAGSLGALGMRAWAAKEYEEAEAMYREKQEYARGQGLGLRDLSFSLDLGQVYMAQGDTARARPIFEEILRLHSEAWIRGWACCGLGFVALLEGNLSEAARLADLMVGLGRSAAMPRLIPLGLGLRGAVLARTGSILEALAVLGQALHMAHGAGEVWWIRIMLPWVAYAMYLWGDMTSAATLCAAGFEEPEPGLREVLREVREQAETKLGPDELQTCWRAGKAMSLDQAAAYALEWLEERGEAT